MDNDAFLSFERANAYGLRAHGTLTGPTADEEFRLLVRFHAVWHQEADAPDVRVSEVRLSPTRP